MRLRYERAALAVIATSMLATAAVHVTEGCGGSKAANGNQAPPNGNGLPGPAGGPTTSTEERVFAVDSILLGETDRAGNVSTDAWKSYGYNLDGLVTSATDDSSPDLAKVCKRAAGARATIHQDGDNGIDNAFGKEILPLLDVVLSAPTKTVTDSIHAGTFTILLKLVGLTDDPAQTNTGLTGTILVGAPYGPEGGPTPTFDLGTDWPTVNGSADPIASAYINQGLFVNAPNNGTGGGATVRLDLHVAGQVLSLVINSAIITFKHDPAGSSLDQGTIAGVMNTEAFIASVANAAGALSEAFCTPAVKQNLIDTIRQASDMMQDGTQNPNATCDAISVGLGFTARRVAEPTKEAGAPPPAGDPCTAPRDAGADG